MTVYILIATFWIGRGGAAISQEFSSEAACVRAWATLVAVKYMTQYPGWSEREAVHVCIPK